MDNPEWFVEVPRNYTRSFKLLGAPFGSGSFTDDLTRKRIRKVQNTLNEGSKMMHSQGAPTILRNSGGFNKLSYSARTTPPHLIAPALGTLSASMRETLSSVVGNPLEDDSWHLASLLLRDGGLGLRDPGAHAAGAYLASFAACGELAQAIDPKFDPTDADGFSFIALSREHYNAAVAPEDQLTALDCIPKQKKLSRKVDARSLAHLLAKSDAHFRAHVKLLSNHGASAWLLSAVAAAGAEESWNPELFRLALRRRLRCRIFEDDRSCPYFGLVMDSWGDHAELCGAKGKSPLGTARSNGSSGRSLRR